MGSLHMTSRHSRTREHARRGQGLVEYAFIILLVALAVVAAVALLGPAISSIFTQISPAL